MSKNQTKRIAELEAKVMVYEEIIRKSNFCALVPDKGEMGFCPRNGGGSA